MRGPNNYPYTDDEWWLRSEVPRDPTQFAFGLPEVWEGEVYEDDGYVWVRVRTVQSVY